MKSQKEFLELFAKLEDLIKLRFKGSQLEKYNKKTQDDKNMSLRNKFKDLNISIKDQELFKIACDLRNNVCHGQGASYSPLYNVSEDFYDEIVRLKKSFTQTIYEKCIHIDNVQYCIPEMNLMNVLSAMKDKNHTHVPILDQNKKILGVLSENTLLLSYLKKKKIDKNTIVNDVLEEASLNAKGRRDVVRLVNKNLPMADIKKLFRESMDKKDKDRLTLLLVTSDTKAKEKDLIGIYTIWDLNLDIN